MKTAEEYLESWLGGNMNIATLTPFAICEFARDYHNYIIKCNQEKHKLNDPNLCSICHKNYVDSANGYDTCQQCLNNI